MSFFEDHPTVISIIAIILGIIGLVWLIYGIWRNVKIRDISEWPKTNAFVLNSIIEPANRAAGSTYIEPRNFVVTKKNSSAQYIPKVAYRYNVDGRDYQSFNVVFSGQKTYNALDTKTIIGQIYPGSIISVYYNPNKPSESYIYNSNTSYINIIIGVILLLLAIYLLYRHVPKSKYVTSTSVKTSDSNSTLTEIVTGTKGTTIKTNKNVGTTKTTGPTISITSTFRRGLY